MKSSRGIIIALIVISGIVNCVFANKGNTSGRSENKYFWFSISGTYISYGTVLEEQDRIDRDTNLPEGVIQENGYKTVKGTLPNVEPAGTPDIALYSHGRSLNNKEEL